VSSTTSPKRPILRYQGGKWRLAPWIIAHFPEHRVYVEPFGGSGSVLLRKPRSYGEIYNDLDSEVVNLFRVLRSKEDATELIRLIELTPYARDEFFCAYEPSDDPIERARRLVVRACMGFGNSGAINDSMWSSGFRPKTGFRSNSNRSNTHPARDWCRYPDGLSAIVDRLQAVVIENAPAMKVMAQHDEPETLHYCDPPYVHSTRSKGNKHCAKHKYRHEMTDDDHRDLAEFLKRLKGFVIVSGYNCPLYEELFGDWARVDKSFHADGARDRIESLWLSPRTAGAIQFSLLTEDAA